VTAVVDAIGKPEDCGYLMGRLAERQENLEFPKRRRENCTQQEIAAFQSSADWSVLISGFPGISSLLMT
jgi:membrane protein YqaA with SNARE-associated domain